MSAGAPELASARLRLVPHSPEIFAALAELWADPEVTRFIGGTPSTSRESWMRMLTYCGSWSVCGYGYWAILESASGRYVGDVGFADFHRESTPSITGVPEAGWALASWAWGRGYATEALGRALSWLDTATPHVRSVCIVSPQNAASIRVAQKAGFGQPAPLLMNQQPLLLFSREPCASRARDTSA